MKKRFIYLLSMIMLFAFSIPTVSAEQQSGIRKVKDHVLNVDGESVTLTESINNGVKVYTISQNVKDRKKVALIADQYLSKLSKVSNVKALSNQTCETQDKTGYGSNSYARNQTVVELCSWPEQLWWGPIESHKSVSGYQYGRWMDSNPFNFDMVILNQSSTVSGVGVTVSWPPSWNKSGNTASWSSQPIYDTWYAYAERNYVEGWSQIWVNINITDTSDIYIGSNIYKPSVSISF